MPGLFGYGTVPTTAPAGNDTPPVDTPPVDTPPAGNDTPPADDQQQGQDQPPVDDQPQDQAQDQQPTEPFVTLDDGTTVPVADYVQSTYAQKEVEIAAREARADERERWLSATTAAEQAGDQPPEEEPVKWDPLNTEEMVFDTDTERVLATRLDELGNILVDTVNENKELKKEIGDTRQSVHNSQYQQTLARIEEKFSVSAQEIDDFYLQNPNVRDPEIIAEIISTRRAGDEQKQTKTNETRTQVRQTRESQVSKIGTPSGAPASNPNRPAPTGAPRTLTDPYNPNEIASKYKAFTV